MAKQRYIEPSHYLEESEDGKRLYIKRTVDRAISFTFSNSETGHKKAAAKLLSLEQSGREIHQLLLRNCPQHVKDQLNGKATIQSESVRSETSGTGNK
jgi:hypothetical protein